MRIRQECDAEIVSENKTEAVQKLGWTGHLSRRMEPIQPRPRQGPYRAVPWLTITVCVHSGTSKLQNG